MTYPFYAFEKGSTSGTTNDSHNKIFEAVRTSGQCAPLLIFTIFLLSLLTVVCNMQVLQREKTPLLILANYDLIMFTYKKFQIVSFMLLKRFQYESPGFCCGKDLFRMSILGGLFDVLRLDERDASNVGKQTCLPNSFIGGPRDMRQRYMDAIALVQQFGKPDLFITITCNPSWPEIKEHLSSSDEFQKRGLPHAHFLIILSNEHKLLTAEAYDDIIKAELPDECTESALRKLVIKHMMHGPCGSLNLTNSCTKKKGYCKFKYPKKFADKTSKGSDSYPIYKRRNTGEVVKVRHQYLDNSSVVPYNPYLLGKFNCHINVEVCSDIKVVKYLYKYICKGHDKIAFCVQNNDAAIEIDDLLDGFLLLRLYGVFLVLL
ncbi:hypothetical protein KY290_029894 [Solanum tuberosum]|uniref:Helitron helicase-like domain-containing protein n=1 Tax=Solanum tuberosum TaxID=4113 RepID=A0ABQ7UM09_SOLTU|nr:hypothetical protein KY284_028929 [Solanum tuberosum]KAH0750662.1 hypothetical protein KY290_029894 [Solanum tuberosum]